MLQISKPTLYLHRKTKRLLNFILTTMTNTRFFLKLIARLSNMTTTYTADGRIVEFIRDDRKYEVEFDEDGEFVVGNIFKDAVICWKLVHSTEDPYEMVDEICYEDCIKNLNIK